MHFVRLFGVSAKTRIVDVGGTPFNWELVPIRPELTLINVHGEESVKGRRRTMVYDGYKLPFDDHSFDVCFSNSVIEHVGDQWRVRLFAEELRRVARTYYVQTPNRFFPIEPHFLCLFVHWLPFRLQRKLMRYFSLWGWLTGASQDETDHMLRQITLLDFGQMRLLFPDAEIIRERFLGMTKSIIAIKRDKAPVAGVAPVAAEIVLDASGAFGTAGQMPDPSSAGALGL